MSMEIDKVQEIYNKFTNTFNSVMLATVDQKGNPNASYAPCIMDNEKNIFLYISTISQHTKNIQSNLKASVMFIEDEMSAAQIFARKRLTFDCDVTLVSFGTEKAEKISSMFSQKFGAIVKNFKKMSDFKLFSLTPNSGRFVFGFGMAYDILGSDLHKLNHVSGGGHGGGHAYSHSAPDGYLVKKEEELTVKSKSRIIDHMNADHADSVLNIVKYFGGYSEATKAFLVDIEKKKLKVTITIDSKDTDIFVSLPSDVITTNDAHQLLIKMSKESRKKLTSESVA